MPTVIAQVRILPGRAGLHPDEMGDRMSSRATTQAISLPELTEGANDAVSSSRLLQGWTNAVSRSPRLVAPAAENISVEPSADAEVASSRTAKAAKGKATKARAARTRIAKPKTTKAETTRTETTEAGAAEPTVTNAQQALSAPVTVAAAPAVPAVRERTSRAFAITAALALASVAAYFSVAGMAEIFPGAPVAVMVLAATMEAGKLVIAGWLAAHWLRVGWKMRSVMVALVVGLALINAAGVFGKLVEAHVGVAVSARSSVAERIEALDARVTAQKAAITDLDGRIAQIDRAVDESTRRGRVTRAINIAAQERATRDGLDAKRQAATATLVGLQAERAALVGERTRVEASAGPIQYLAMMVGTAPEAAVRWLIILMVLCCDPAAIALTVAAAGSRRLTPNQSF
jgi:hypothetical protein